MGSSRATTCGRPRSRARRNSNANSSRPGTTGKYVRRPRRRLPASGTSRSISPGITQRFLPECLKNGRLYGFELRDSPRFHVFQLEGEARDVDAVAHRIALVGGVGLLQEIGHVVKNAVVGERQVLAQDVVLLVPL